MKPFPLFRSLPDAGKPPWQRPTITSLTDEELLQQLGPAQANNSVLDDGGAFGLQSGQPIDFTRDKRP